MRARRVTVLLILVLAVYLGLVAWRGGLLIATGTAMSIGLGLGVVTLPVLAGMLIWREVRFGAATQRLAAELAACGGLPADELPRRPSGRVVRQAADLAFAERKSAVEAAPEDWASWFRLAAAYDDAGDRRRAREAMRRAISLYGRRTAPPVVTP